MNRPLIALHGFAFACMLAIGTDLANAQSGRAPALPAHLRDTGLYAAGSMSAIDPRNMLFSPQYPLWSDGAAKRRWLYLPLGTSIDASNPDAWVFPPGTRLWKEFSHGRAVETRFIERLADGSWRYAAYVWKADGSDAVLAPPEGIAALRLPGAPGGRYEIPAEADCRACHEGAAVPVLGASALQLSADRDPLAPHAEAVTTGHADLRHLAARGLLRNLPAALIESPPRIAIATPAARAALGYLHGNCGHCHNDAGPLASLDLVLAQGSAASNVSKALRSMISYTSRYRPRASQPISQRVVPGHPEASVLALRMQSRNPLTQMPPLGTRMADEEGLALVVRWIQQDLPTSTEHTP
ncbi:MAG: hypothetical protein ACKVQA_19860 [Burkholderiales bacterium]